MLAKKIKYDKAEEKLWVDGIYKFYGDASDEELDVIPSKSGGKWLSQSLLDARKKMMYQLFVSLLQLAGITLSK